MSAANDKGSGIHRIAALFLYYDRRVSVDASRESVGRDEAGLIYRVIKYLFVCMLIVFSLTNGLGRFPEDWDTLMYHLSRIDQWLQSSSVFVSDCYNWSHPGNNELIGLWMVAPFSGDFLISLNNLPAVALLAFASISLGRCLGLSHTLSYLTATAIVSNGVVFRQLLDAKNDIAVAGLFVACLTYALQAARTDRIAELVWGGLTLGLLAGTKYNALGYAALALATAALIVAVARGLRAMIIASALWSCCLASWGGFWYVRNTIMVGNPLYPMGLTRESNLLTVIYPALDRSSFWGCRRPELLPLAIDAVARKAGSVHLVAILAVPIAVIWLATSGFFMSRGRHSQLDFWIRNVLVIWLAGSGAILLVTPFSVEDIPGKGTTTCRRDLWIDERGTSGDLSEVWVRCECKAERPIIEATKADMHALGRCNGWQPWLGPRVFEPCDEQNRMLVRTASNAYFPQTMSVISLPDRDEAVAKAVDQVWEHYLQYIDDLDDLIKERKRKPPVAAALEGFSDEDLFAEVQSRKQGKIPGLDKSVKQAEFETLVTAKEEIGSDKPDGDFFARYLPKKHWDQPWMAAVERVVLVHRLREVIATVGFTRFESSTPDVEGELEIGVTRAQLARDVSWLPAIENRGEGIFIQFKSEAIDAWMEKPAVKRRGEQLVAGFDCWKKDHEKSKRKFFGLPYVLLHSLSHQLITAVSLECGYPASSIRERIYSGPYGDGILLYTGTPDAEGTMGGLVQAGRQIARHLKAAIDLGRLCSNDPVCAQHAPEHQHECRFLHGAACHGCLLIAETSCEQHNDFLDRALVISTVDGNGAEFFRQDGS